MRENRTSGSEGGEPVKSRLPYPYHVSKGVGGALCPDLSLVWD